MWLHSHIRQLTSYCSADLPYVHLVYYVLPMSALEDLAFTESHNDSIIGTSQLELIRVITISLEIPHGEETLVYIV